MGACMANGTAEVLTPDGDADEERGIEIAELYANSYTLDGQLRTTDSAASASIAEQRSPADPSVEVGVTQPQLTPVEGGKALYGTFDKEIRYAAGLSVKGVVRGRDIIKYRHGVGSRLGRQTVLRVFPGGR